MPSTPPKVLIIGYVWPEPNASAAGVREMELIRIFREAAWSLTYASPCRENEALHALKALGVETVQVQANDPAFDRFIAELQPDYVIFDRFVIEEQFGWRVKEHSPGSLRVIDTQDLHFLRRTREAALKRGAALEDIFEARVDLLTEDALRELAAIYRSDLSLILSDFELKLLKDRFGIPERLLFLLGFCSAVESDIAASSDRDSAGFVVIGNFRHPPNADGVLWLKREIWPLIRRLKPDARVDIYGAYPSREMMDLHEPSQGFHVLGPAHDLRPTLRSYRVNLAPLRFGAGIKGKIADGWSAGLPCVTTPIGAEGMTGSNGFGGAVARNAADFAEKAVALHGTPELCKSALDAGHRTLHELFGKKLNSERLISALTRAKAEQDESRAQNLVGQILWHQSHRATTYFSRWIELKEARDRKAD